MGIEYIYPEFEVDRAQAAVSAAGSAKDSVPTRCTVMMKKDMSCSVMSPNA